MMNKYQKGYFAPVFTSTFIFVALAFIGFAGWCVIELFLWLFSFINVSIG